MAHQVVPAASASGLQIVFHLFALACGVWYVSSLDMQALKCYDLRLQA
jgi:hypothetical protein